MELVADSGVSFTPVCRCGETPLDLTIELQLNGRVPFEVTFTWGDGDEETVITNEFQVVRTHRYTGAGNSTLTVAIEDDSDASRTHSFGVHVFAVAATGIIDLNLTVEGYVNGTVPTLFVPDGLPRGLTAIAIANGTAATQTIQFGWDIATCAAATPTTFDLVIAVPPGQYAWVTLNTVVTGAVGSSQTISITAATPSIASPVVSRCVEFTEQVAATTSSSLLPVVEASLSPATRSVDVGSLTLFELTIENVGTYAARIDTFLTGLDPSISAIPTNPGLWGTIDGYFRPDTGIQRLHLFPNETVEIPVSILGTRAIADEVNFGVRPQRMSLNPNTVGSTATTQSAITITGTSGGLITTIDATILASTRVQLSGKVLTLIDAPFVDVFFQVRVQGSTEWSVFPPSPIRVTTDNTVISRIVTLLADTEYDFEFVGQTSAGEFIHGGLVSFDTGELPAVSQDFRAWLYALEGATGYSAEVWGYFFGGVFLLGILLFMNSNIFVDRFREIPTQVQLLVIAGVVALNVFLFLWHVGILILLSVLAAVMVIQLLRDARAGGTD